ncbi:hypothetical protein D3C73_1558770 [compost metagenome]
MWFAKYILELNDKPSLFIAGSVVALVLGTIFRFFAYRFWVFNEELDAEPEFSHDHKLLDLHHKPKGPSEAGAAGPATGEVPSIKNV